MIKFAFILIIICVTYSCREEIIEPGNFVGKVNEPVQLRESSSYTFLLNAENLTMNISAPLYFSSSRTRFNVKLAGYESGYTSVEVQDFNMVERFSYFVAKDVSYHSELLDGYVPATINIRTNNFTGKIQIEFRKTL